MKLTKRITAVLITLLMLLCTVGCDEPPADNTPQTSQTASTALTVSTTVATAPTTTTQTTTTTAPTDNEYDVDTITPDTIPPYSGEPFVLINDNQPFFTDKEKATSKSFETYSPLDTRGRCGVAYACVGKDIMPTEDRGSISEVTPSGWHNEYYDFVDGKYVYNRCHLLGFQLTGENANEKNLITGTRYMNVEGMLPFENMIADYIKETDNHVLLRVTPIYEGNHLVASGVLMEAYSVEDNGDGICYNVYCYNVQPGVIIDYATGHNRADDRLTTPTTAVTTPTNAQPATTYILNTNTKKIHYPSCSSAKKIADKNRKETTDTLDSLLAQGYDTCGNCF